VASLCKEREKKFLEGALKKMQFRPFREGTKSEINGLAFSLIIKEKNLFINKYLQYSSSTYFE
jgi:hypothetical protein